jgi:hypothetical protein
MSDFWYYVDRSGRVGPLTRQELKATLATIQKSADVLVWCQRFPNWKRAGDVPELGAKNVASPSNTWRAVQETRQEKRQSTRRSGWWMIIAAVPFLRSAGASVGRKLMGQLPFGEQMTKQVTLWTREGPPDSVVNALNVLEANRLLAVSVVACVAYGIYDGLLRNSIFSGLVVGFSFAAIITLAIWAARKYRVKRPSPLLLKIGTIVYLFGCVLGLYSVFLIIYETSYLGAMNAAARLLPSAIFYPALGWGIRYVLGANRDRDHHASAGEIS